MNRPTLFQAQIRNVKLGSGVKIVEPSNIYECQIGDNTFVGPFVEIQRGVTIGKNCKIQSHTFVCELVTIGDETIVAHGVMFINDTFAIGTPANGDKKLWRETTIGKGVSIGSNATILPVDICDNVVIGAGAVVVDNIEVSGVYVGNPAKKIRDI